MLDAIEHEILRPKFNEPKTNMALVCVAKGCPSLRNEPYTATRLDDQLNDQSFKFLNNNEKFRIDIPNNKVHVSSIFDWFGEDFVKNYGDEKGMLGFSNKEKAVLSFISRYVEPSEKAAIMKGGFSIEYLNYDWSLNEKVN